MYVVMLCMYVMYHVCMYVCMSCYVCILCYAMLCMYVCMHASMYVLMYEYMHVCRYLYMYAHRCQRAVHVYVRKKHECRRSTLTSLNRLSRFEETSLKKIFLAEAGLQNDSGVLCMLALEGWKGSFRTPLLQIKYMRSAERKTADQRSK